VLRPRRYFFVLIAAVALCAIGWQSARMQSPLRRITNTPENGKSLSPTISGDGRIVAFESTEDIANAGGAEGFRAIRANVSVDPPTFLQMGGARAPAPAISQDGSRITFAAKENPLGTNNDFNSEIFLYDGAKLNQITITTPGDASLRGVNGNFLPSISDDGRYIAFSSNRNLTSQNADGNFEVFVYDTVAASFVQATNSTNIVGFTDAKISGDGLSLFYIRDTGLTPSANRDLVRQNRQTLFVIGLLATNAPKLSLTYGRAVSDDGLRVVWSAETAPDSSQVFLWDGRNGVTRQITTLGERVTEVPLHPSISGDGSRISFATRRTVMPGNSDNSIELYSFDLPSGTMSRVTNAPVTADGFDGSRREVEIISSLNDDGSVIAFNFPRILSGAVANADFVNNSEIYVTGTAPRPTSGTLTVLNGASFGHEPATTEAVAPDSVAVARGGALAFRSEQSQPTAGVYPTTVAGTTVTVNGRSAQIFFVSPSQVNFHVPPATELGTAEVVVTNSDGFQSRGTVPVLNGAPGVFTKSGDGLGEGVILDANTLMPGPFDPTGGNLRLIVFATGTRRATTVTVTAGSRALTVESIAQNPEMPGMDEIHVLVPADLRGVGKVELIVTADGRDSNPVIVEFIGDARRDVLINEFLADPAASTTDPTVGDANRDGVRSASQDEFVELVNTTVNDIDISGYRIFSRGTGADVQRHVFAAGTVLRSCSAMVVFGGGTTSFNPNDPAFGGAQVVEASSGGLSLGNAEGAITLQDQSGAIVNLVAYGGSSGIEADNDQSVTRSPDITGNFAQHLAASGGARPYSPGTQINGAPFSSCTPAVARVEVLPATATIDAGAQQQFTAKAFDGSNNEIPGVIFTWQSSNTAVATVDQNGLANGISAGTSEIRATGRGVQSPPATLTVNPVAPPNVVINEVDSDQTGTDTAEFVEIYDGGTGNISLTRLVVVFYNGGDDMSYAAFDLDGFNTNANGYFTLGSAAVPGVDLVFADGLMQNGPDAVAVYVGNASDFPNGTPVTTTNLIDALVYDTNDADDAGLLTLLNPGQPQVNEDTAGNGISNSNQRCPNGSGGPRNTSTYNQFVPTADAANVCAAVAPTLSINDVSANEGNSGTTTFTFTVSLSSPAPAGGVTFDIATADSTATVADNDYVAKGLTAQTIAAGAQTYQFTVDVNGDATVEPNETFLVNVTNVTGATMADGQGVGTIQNDDSPTVSISDVSANETNSGSTTFTFTVTSSLPAPAGGITFDIATADGTATVADNDYVARSLIAQTIPAGNTTYTFDVTVNGDANVEGNETFFVNLSNVAGATATDSQGLGTIQNDDGALLVISQIYAGGGNAGAQFTNDFVEIFNRGTTTVNFASTPFSVQYAAATSTSGFSKLDLTSGSVAPGQYFLVQLGGGANGVALPTPDATGTIAMAATAGKVALVNGTTTLAASGCPLSSTVADFVGYGTTANCFEGTAPAPAPSNTTADYRKAGGCTDTNDNAADLFASAPSPRNTSSPLNNCVAGAPPNLSINDVTVLEGNSGTTTATFTVSLSAPAPSTDVVFDIATQDNTATTANSDYVSKTLTTQVIPAGQLTYTFTVNVNGDAVVEPDESFFVNVTNVSGATVTDGQAIGTIQNDDLPTLTINDVTQNEGNGGTSIFTFTVSLSTAAPTGGVTFDISTQDNTATAADNDYVLRSLTSQTIAAGNTTYTFDVTVNGDTAIEPNETFFVNVTNVSGATVVDGQGQGTIQNDDSPNLSINDVSAVETNSGTTIFTFTVTSTLPAPAGGITFDIATADGTAQDDDPATEDNDYVARALTSQTIPATQTTYTFDVTVNGDSVIEPDETFFVNISNASGATISDASGTGTILNDDTPDLVISQVYAGGGNAGAQYTNDFVEIFNQGATTVDFATTAFSVQYAGATGTFGSNKVDLTSGTIAPGQYFLIQLSSGGANGSPLPTPDAAGSIAMAATAGKVALVLGTTALSGSACPLTANVVDFVGYGTTADCFEGSGRAPAPSNTTADFRRNGGCTDTNDNAADFLVSVPFPRNTGSPLNNCVAGAPPNITIADIAIAEGNSGTTTATFTVSLSAPAPATDVTFDIATADGTAQDDIPATEDNDYVARTLTTQVIPAGQTSYTFTVTVNGDVVIENDETFLVNVTNASGATITDGQATGTIQNDDQPALTINDISQNETNAGTTTFTFTVNLSAPAPTGGVAFDIATADGTAQDDNPATEDNDYVAQTLTSQTISAGNTTYTFNVTVNGDVNIEPSETFFVNVTNVTGATVADGAGQGTILNDDSPSLSIADVSANETNTGTTTFTFTVTSSLPAPAGGITFDIATADGTAQDDVPATEDNDYVAKVLTSQTIPATQTTYTFDVTVNGDTFVEADETFLVNITNATGADVSDGSATGTIVNDDVANVVISQIYGAGGNVGATHQNDFIEIFNRGTTTVNLAGWSVQYVAATGTGTWSVTGLSGMIVPGQYYLVQEGGGANGSPLPTPDATGTIGMAATAGKVALLNNGVALTGGCPSSANIIDLVGYGTTANCFEGSGPAPAPGTTTADFRKVGGCTDTNDNAADFLTATPAPRNTASPLNDCNAPPNLTIDNVSVTEGNGGTVVAAFTVSLSSPAPAGGVTFDIATQNDTATTADNDYVLNSLTSQTITAGNSSYTFNVTVNGDLNVEPDETFFVNVTNVTGATIVDGQGLGTILNDDSAAVPTLSINDVTLSEGNAGTTTFAFTVSLTTAAPAGGVTFDISTADGTAQDDNPATEDNDYVAQTLTSQTITAGNTTYTFNVTVNGDVVVEPGETFFVNVTNVTGATLGDGQGLGTIQNDDSAASPGAIVISQVYGGGGNAGATFTHDFIELFNRGGTAVDVTGWSVQYNSAAGAGAFQVTPICPTGPCLIQPGQYFLVQEASNAAVGSPLPTPNATGTIIMAATAGRVALVNNTTAIAASATCATQLAAAVDFVGYGTTAACFEGAAPAPAPSATNSDQRAANGCTDTNVNSADFATGAPNPRNTSSPLNVCSGPEPQPEKPSQSAMNNWIIPALKPVIFVVFGP